MKDDIYNLRQGELHIAIKEEAAKLYNWATWNTYQRFNRVEAKKLDGEIYHLSIAAKRRQLRAIRTVAVYEAENGVITDY